MKLAKWSSGSFSLVTSVLFFLFFTVIPALSSQQSQVEVPQVVRKSGGVLAASAIRRVEPAYPPLAKAAKVSGTIVVEVTIDESGNVIAAHAISGPPLLKDAA